MAAERRFAIISNQAFSLSNFRGPLIKAIVARGWKVYALAPDFQDDTRAAVLALGAEPVDCTFSRTGLNPLADMKDMLHLARLLRKLRVDASLGYFIKPVIFGTIAAWLAGVPKRAALIAGLGYVFVAPEEGAGSIARRGLRSLVTQLYKFALARAGTVFFQNDDDLEQFVSGGLVRRDKAFNTYGTGVDLDEWKAAPPVIEPVTFLLAARLLREKGIAQYAEAARRVKAWRPETRFVLLGGLDPNPGGLTREEVEKWVAEGILEWHGHQPIAQWLSQVGVYVLPSYYREGVPRSVQEAMAMARPIITTDTVGCRTTVEVGVNGFLVPPRDVPALEQAMRKFIEDPSLIATMGAASRRLVEERFDVRRVNALMIEKMGI